MKTQHLIERIKQTIDNYGEGSFTAKDIIEKMGLEMPFNRESARVAITRDLVRTGVLKHVGRKGQSFVYQAVKVGPQKIAKAADPILAPVKTATEIVRDIIRGFNGREFTTPEILEQLSTRGIQVGMATFSVMISRDLLKRQRFIERVGKKGVYVVYQQCSDPSSPKPAGNEQRDPRSVLVYDGSFPAAFLSVAAGLERFSLEYLIAEVKKTGSWDRGNIKHSCYVFISTLKKRGLIVASHERPTVYSMTPDFYLYNVNQLIKFTDIAPHLEQRIMQNFAKHCGPDPEPGQEMKDPETINPVVETTVPKTDNPVEATIISGEKERQKKEILKMKDKLNDRNLDIITLTSRNRDLESKVQKLNREIGRLTAKVDEKDRINSALQRQLNIARDELSKTKHRQKNAFSLGELAHLKH